MKTLIFFVVLFHLGMTTNTFAQAGAQMKTTKGQTVEKKRRTKTETQNPAAANADDNTTTFTSTSSGQAYGGRHLSISDPTVVILNERANGDDVPVSSSGIVGMPKRAYGFANGKILLRNTTALSSGTAYGSGAVGTGTTITGIGTAENVIGVNGKNPYAGPWLWGSRLPIRLAAPAKSTTIPSAATNQ